MESRRRRNGSLLDSKSSTVKPDMKTMYLLDLKRSIDELNTSVRKLAEQSSQNDIILQEIRDELKKLK